MRTWGKIIPPFLNIFLNRSLCRGRCNIIIRIRIQKTNGKPQQNSSSLDATMVALVHGSLWLYSGHLLVIVYFGYQRYQSAGHYSWHECYRLDATDHNTSALDKKQAQKTPQNYRLLRIDTGNHSSDKRPANGTPNDSDPRCRCHWGSVTFH